MGNGVSLLGVPENPTDQMDWQEKTSKKMTNNLSTAD